MQMFAKSLGDDNAELRPLEPWQAAEFLEHIDRGREFIGRYIGLADAVTDLASSREFLTSYAQKTAVGTGRIWGIWFDGTLVGGVVFRVMDLSQGTAEIGCSLEPAAAGKGLMTRAVRVIIDWAVEDLGVHRFEWRAASANTASIAVAKRLGMRRDGILRELYLRNGERHDIEVWSVLAPEWRATGRSVTSVADLEGSLPYTGRPMTIEEINEGIAEGAADRDGHGNARPSDSG
jgi:ribosomal-protein-serine acetyltransferase